MQTETAAQATHGCLYAALVTVRGRVVLVIGDESRWRRDPGCVFIPPAGTTDGMTGIPTGRERCVDSAANAPASRAAGSLAVSAGPAASRLGERASAPGAVTARPGPVFRTGGASPGGALTEPVSALDGAATARPCPVILTTGPLADPASALGGAATARL